MVIEDLISNLKSQVEMHQVLLEVLNQEQALPATCDVLELQEVQAVRDSAVRRIRDLEAIRLNIIQTYKNRHADVSDLTLQQIVASSAPQYREPLIQLRLELTELIDRIRQVGKVNAEKAVARIACFREVTNSIHKSFHRHPLYSMKGVVNTPKGACLFNKSI